MTKGRNMWLAPALLGAFWVAKNRSGSRSGRGILSQFTQSRSRGGWMGQSRGGRGQSIGSSILQSLFGGGRRRSGYGLFR
jgi:hypothetical protein